MLCVSAWNFLHSRDGLSVQEILTKDTENGILFMVRFSTVQKIEEERRNKSNLWMTGAARYGL